MSTIELRTNEHNAVDRYSSITTASVGHRFFAISALICLGTIQCMTAYADDQKTKFPAEIRVVSNDTDDQGRLRLRVRLLIENHVTIYANPVRASGMDHASARITVLDETRKRLSAKVTYPTGDKYHDEFMGDWYLYRKSVDFVVVLTDKPSLPLIIHAKIAGYNEHKSYCLGVGEIEMTIDCEPANR